MREPLGSSGELFSRDQVCRILKLDDRQLAAWERQGLIQPSRVVSGTPEVPDAPDAVDGRSKPPLRLSPHDCYYTFGDIVTLRTLIKLRNGGVPASRLRMAHAALKQMLADVERPFTELQIKGSGKNVIVQFQGGRIEPVTGQFLLEFGPESKSADEGVRQFRRPGSSEHELSLRKKAIAERFFLAGLRYEETGRKPERAIRAYRKAIDLNPQAVGAFINLGTIYYNLGQLADAEQCYQAALAIDPAYGLVHFNLGNVADERNDLDAARHCYEEAIRLDPSYPDPHYNLALIYEKLGLHGRARQQWSSYLKLDQQSQWASYARLQLERTPLRIVRLDAGSDQVVE